MTSIFKNNDPIITEFLNCLNNETYELKFRSIKGKISIYSCLSVPIILSNNQKLERDIIKILS